MLELCFHCTKRMNNLPLLFTVYVLCNLSKQ